MFKCYGCNTTFLEPKIYYEHHPYGMGYATERFAVCPRCGDNFEEATQCTECGEWFFKDELTDGVCEDCNLED